MNKRKKKEHYLTLIAALATGSAGSFAIALIADMISYKFNF